MARCRDNENQHPGPDSAPSLSSIEVAAASAAAGAMMPVFIARFELFAQSGDFGAQFVQDLFDAFAPFAVAELVGFCLGFGRACREIFFGLAAF